MTNKRKIKKQKWTRKIYITRNICSGKILQKFKGKRQNNFVVKLEIKGEDKIAIKQDNRNQRKPKGEEKIINSFLKKGKDFFFFLLF